MAGSGVPPDSSAKSGWPSFVWAADEQERRKEVVASAWQRAFSLRDRTTATAKQTDLNPSKRRDSYEHEAVARSQPHPGADRGGATDVCAAFNPGRLSAGRGRIWEDVRGVVSSM